MKIKGYIISESLESAVQNIDLILRARNTNILKILVRNELEQAVDISSSTVFFTVKPTTSTPDAIAPLRKDIISHTSPTGGETEIILTPIETSSLLGTFIYDIKIRLSTGLIYTLAEGTVVFQRSLSTRES